MSARLAVLLVIPTSDVAELQHRVAFCARLPRALSGLAQWRHLRQPHRPVVLAFSQFCGCRTSTARLQESFTVTIVRGLRLSGQFDELRNALRFAVH